jgi:hypothetical protein
MLFDNREIKERIRSEFIHIYYPKVYSVTYEQLLQSIAKTPIRIETVKILTKNFPAHNFNLLEVHNKDNGGFTEDPFYFELDPYVMNPNAIITHFHKVKVIDHLTTWKFELPPDAIMEMRLYPEAEKK